MRTDPRIGLTISLLICAVAGLWLLAQSFASGTIWEALWPVVGFRTHVLAFLALFALVACPFIALLFYRYLRVKADLLAGRNVIARWTADPASLEEFSSVTEAYERAEKRRALYVTFFFIVLLFAVALLDPEVAVPILLAAAALAMVMMIASWFGNRIRKSQSQMPLSEIIIGTEGLFVDDVLHVWSTFVSWLVAAEIEKGPPPVLTITYAFCWGRYGPQSVSVIIPIGPDNWDLAVAVEQRLQQALYKRSASARRGRGTAHTHSKGRGAFWRPGAS